jgi:hypothetical protein
LCLHHGREKMINREDAIRWGWLDPDSFVEWHNTIEEEVSRAIGWRVDLGLIPELDGFIDLGNAYESKVTPYDVATWIIGAYDVGRLHIPTEEDQKNVERRWKIRKLPDATRLYIGAVQIQQRLFKQRSTEVELDLAEATRP